jgi:hypothetical protein
MLYNKSLKLTDLFCPMVATTLLSASICLTIRDDSCENSCSSSVTDSFHLA